VGPFIVGGLSKTQAAANIPVQVGFLIAQPDFVMPFLSV
jgi:hypothetical protein